MKFMEVREDEHSESEFYYHVESGFDVNKREQIRENND